MTRHGLVAVILAGLCLAGLPGLVAAAGDAPLTIPVSEIERGQKGYGISVFAGTEPQRFEVEVLGVLRQTTAGNNAIIARLSGQGLEDSGVIAGMSGSPVYIEGRLAGAVAYSWSFSKGAIAGITPILQMRQVGAAAASDGGAMGRVSATAPSLADLAARRLPEDLLERGLRQLARFGGDGGGLGDGVRPTFQWAMGGFGEGSRHLLTDALGPGVVLGAASDASAAMDLALSPGSPVSAVLVQGDLRLAAGATVTDRDGDEVLAFGHPFLGLGPISIPMAAAEIITVVPSLSNSFKISNMGPVVGAFQEDRQAAVFGRMGAVARTIPVSVQVEGQGLGAARTYHMQVAELAGLTPTLIALSVLGSLDGSGHNAGNQGLDIDLQLRLEKHGDVRLAQGFDGANAGTQAAIFVLSVTGALVGSSFEDAHLEEVKVAIRRHAEVRTTTIVSAFTPRTTVRPGETIPLFVELQPYQGQRRRHRLEVTIPEDQADGAYYLMVADGSTADAARQAVAPVAPEDYRQLLGFVRSLHSNRELHVLGLVGAPGLVVGGVAMPQLPGSIHASRAAALPVAATGMRLAVVQELEQPMEAPLSGVVRVDLKVQRR